MRVVIKTIFTIETPDPAVAKLLVGMMGRLRSKAFALLKFQEAVKYAQVGDNPLEISGPNFDVHRIHEPEIDGPKPDVSGEPDAIDPTVLIADADGSPVE